MLVKLTQKEIAKEALVIMLVALNSNWLFSAKWVIWFRKSQFN